MDKGLSLKALSSLWWEESPETQGNKESTEKFYIQTGAMGTREGQPTVTAWDLGVENWRSYSLPSEPGQHRSPGWLDSGEMGAKAG